jgi:hypothetical protein
LSEAALKATLRFEDVRKNLLKQQNDMARLSEDLKISKKENLSMQAENEKLNQQINTHAIKLQSFHQNAKEEREAFDLRIKNLEKQQIAMAKSNELREKAQFDKLKTEFFTQMMEKDKIIKTLRNEASIKIELILIFGKHKKNFNIYLLECIEFKCPSNQHKR